VPKVYKVLVIDDQEIIYSVVKKTLFIMDIYHVDYAPNGAVGLEMDEKNNYDIITCDITMPVMDGIETAKRIFKRTPDKKLLMITAIGQEDYIRQAIEAGVRNYLLKPFVAQDLIIKIRNLLKEK